MQVLQRFLGFLEDVLTPSHQLFAEVVPLALVHEGLFVGRPVVFALVLDRCSRAVGGVNAIVAIVTVMAVMAVMAVARAYAVDPLLILHLTPPLPERASLLAGRA